GWRDVPVDERHCGLSARATRPAIRQLFVAPLGVDLKVDDASTFERTLYVIRRQIERVTRESARPDGPSTYVASLSSRTLVYKGMLRPTQLRHFYRDLGERSEEHTSELQSLRHLVCRLLLEKKQ